MKAVILRRKIRMSRLDSPRSKPSKTTNNLFFPLHSFGGAVFYFTYFIFHILLILHIFNLIYFTYFIYFIYFIYFLYFIHTFLEDVLS